MKNTARGLALAGAMAVGANSISPTKIQDRNSNQKQTSTSREYNPEVSNRKNQFLDSMRSSYGNDHGVHRHEISDIGRNNPDFAKKYSGIVHNGSNVIERELKNNKQFAREAASIKYDIKFPEGNHNEHEWSYDNWLTKSFYKRG